jgi:hypothetical protein
MKDRGPRPARRREFRVEGLEGRNLLSRPGLGHHLTPPAVIRTDAHTVPIRGMLQGVANLGLPSIDPSTFNATVPVTIAGSGELSHLGHVTIAGSHQTVILASTNYTTSLVVEGHATITAANGDTLTLDYTGVGSRTANGFDDTFGFVITGGTGRFAGATGFGMIHSSDDPGTPTQVPFTFNLEGVISTVGSG